MAAINLETLINKKFGMLTITKAWRESGLLWVECLCECKKSRKLKWNHLSRLRHPNCGCKKGSCGRMDRNRDFNIQAAKFP